MVMVNTSARRSGKTTAQILSAPKGAIYVWVSSSIAYVQNLAVELGRTDITFIGPNQVEDRILGRRKTPVVTDHAAQLTRPVEDALRAHNRPFLAPQRPSGYDRPITSYGDAW